MRRRCRTLHRVGDDYAGNHDNIDLAGNRVSHQVAQPLDTAVCIPVLDDDVATFLVTQLTQALAEPRPRYAIAALSAYPDITDMRDPTRCLRKACNRAGDRYPA
jgi:hypothetical protein